MQAETDPAGKSSRLFLALWPEPVVRQALQGWLEGWVWPSRATPVRPESLHLTVHFLGDVAALRLPDLIDGLQVAFHPFELRFSRPASWPHGISVLLPDAIPEGLLQLQRALGSALQGLALPVEARPYRPHVTLARRAEGAEPPECGPLVHWPVRDYALMESKPGARGAYSVLRSYPSNQS
jgi:RNA 2',3'-cyclic 3'-phosphodiesterase